MTRAEAQGRGCAWGGRQTQSPQSAQNKPAVVPGWPGQGDGEGGGGLGVEKGRSLVERTLVPPPCLVEL